jgi:hypothetical protein
VYQPSRHNASNSNSNVTCSALRASSQHIASNPFPRNPTTNSATDIFFPYTPRRLNPETLLRRSILTTGDFTLVEIPRIAHITAHAKERCPPCMDTVSEAILAAVQQYLYPGSHNHFSYEVGSVHSATVKDILSYPRRLHPTPLSPPGGDPGG